MKTKTVLLFLKSHVKAHESHSKTGKVEQVKEHDTKTAKHAKWFYVQSNIGKAKYVVNYHDGKKTHKDGSPFVDIRIFRNKIELDRFTSSLSKQGYASRQSAP